MSEVAIIGAGAAGIAAARRLGALGRDFILLEAKPVIGGRCITDRESLGVPVDLGAHWLHSPALNPLVDEARQRGIRFGSAALAGRMAVDGRFLSDAEMADCTAHIEECFVRIGDAGRAGIDIPITELLADAAAHPWHGAFRAELVAKQGVAPHLCSTLDFARYVWEGDDLPVLDGYGTLLSALARDLDIRTETPVTAIDWSGQGKVCLETPRGPIEARRVIITVSTGILAEHILFTPRLPDWKRGAIADLPMGSCNKVILRFQRPVFGDFPPSLILPLKGNESVEIVVREGSAEIATCLINGPQAKELSAAGPVAMTDFALERLGGLFGSAILRQIVAGTAIADWDADPFTRGCFSAACPGRADARFDLARSIDDRLFFAGEACARDYIGDVHGAWASGVEAADMVSGLL